MRYTITHKYGVVERVAETDESEIQDVLNNFLAHLGPKFGTVTIERVE